MINKTNTTQITYNELYKSHVYRYIRAILVTLSVHSSLLSEHDHRNARREVCIQTVTPGAK